MNILEIREKLIPYAVPYYDSAEIDNVVNVLKSNWWTHGPVTAEFEKRFAQMVGAKYALAVSSNTAGEHLALTVAGITAGDEVITTPMTFCSTANTIVNCGATPVFVDIDYNTGLIDVEIGNNGEGFLSLSRYSNGCFMNYMMDIAITEVSGSLTLKAE